MDPFAEKPPPSGAACHFFLRGLLHVLVVLRLLAGLPPRAPQRVAQPLLVPRLDELVEFLLTWLLARDPTPEVPPEWRTVHKLLGLLLLLQPRLWLLLAVLAPLPWLWPLDELDVLELLRHPLGP